MNLSAGVFLFVFAGVTQQVVRIEWRSRLTSREVRHRRVHHGKASNGERRICQNLRIELDVTVIKYLRMVVIERDALERNPVPLVFLDVEFCYYATQSSLRRILGEYPFTQYGYTGPLVSRRCLPMEVTQLLIGVPASCVAPAAT